MNTNTTLRHTVNNHDDKKDDFKLSFHHRSDSEVDVTVFFNSDSPTESVYEKGWTWRFPQEFVDDLGQDREDWGILVTEFFDQFRVHWVIFTQDPIVRSDLPDRIQRMVSTDIPEKDLRNLRKLRGLQMKESNYDFVWLLQHIVKGSDLNDDEMRN